MIFYIIPFIFLAALTSFESRNKFDLFIKNKYFYYIISIFFIIFIGLRYEIGCDWPRYKGMFDRYNSLSLIDIVKNSLFSKIKLQESGHIIIASISKNIYVLNLIYSIIFTFPLMYFCSELKRKYFSLLISYPYYVIVIGMGPIRQAACISLLMLSILLIKNNKNYTHIFISIISALIHQSSILFNGIILGTLFSKIKGIKTSKKNIILMIFVSAIFLYCLPSIISKLYYYITLYKYTDQSGTRLIPPAKSSIYIWLIHFVPSCIYLKNIPKFKFNDSLNKILFTFTIIDFLLLPIIFFNSVIAYRLLLYLFPTSILITSHIPDLELFKIGKIYYINFIIGISFLSLIIWLNFAFHASCWVPYKNLLLN